VGKNLLIAIAIFDLAIAVSFFIEGKYPWTIIFLCGTVGNIASLWLL
jgi:hypothetical protein